MNDTEILARTLIGESRPNDMQDAESIAAVVLNRVRWRNWPSKIGDVCMQPRQFSCWNAEDPNRARIMRVQRHELMWYEACWSVAERAVAGTLEDITDGATHYHTPAVEPRWSRNKKPSHVTGGHLFYNDIDTPPPYTAAEALEQERPLVETRTVKGGAVAGAATIGGAVLTAAQDAVTEATSALSPFHAVLPSDWLRYALAAAALIGVGTMLWARYDDRRRGSR